MHYIFHLSNNDKACHYRQEIPLLSANLRDKEMNGQRFKNPMQKAKMVKNRFVAEGKCLKDLEIATPL